MCVNEVTIKQTSVGKS